MGGLINTFTEMLTIEVYEKFERTSFFPKTFKAMFNPDSYSLKYVNRYQEFQGINTASKPAKFSLTEPNELSVKLLIDGTGVTNLGVVQALKEAFSTAVDVYTEVQDFIKLVQGVNVSTHQPNFLVLKWGSLSFQCRLESLDVKYTLFDEDGKPLRAELDTVFIGDLDPIPLESPDITHTRVVKNGDTLPGLCIEIYGSASYYMKVAQANNINHFRALKPGQEVYFPPIKDN